MNEDALNQILAYLKPITIDFEKCLWPQWFDDFEQEMRFKTVPVVQWAHMVKSVATAGVKEVVSSTLRRAEDAGVPKVMYYGIVRDELLDFAGDRYRPEAYLSQMHEIKPGSMKAGPLANTLTQLATEYEKARERAVLQRQKFPSLTPWYLAWLYISKLDPAISGKLPRLGDVPTRTAGNLFDVVRLEAEKAEREVARSNAAAAPSLVAITTPAMQLGTRRRRESTDSEPSRNRSPRNRRRSVDERSTSREPSIERKGILKPAKVGQCGKRSHIWIECWGYLEWTKDPKTRVC